MIDFIKIKLNGCNSQRLLNCPFLDFQRTVSEKTGELATKSIAKYHTCKITVYDNGKAFFSGSFHKMYNSLSGITAPRPTGNGYNGNQYGYEQIKETIAHLIELFEVEPEQMQIQQIEYGSNIATSFNPQDFITGLLMHKGKPFEFRFNEYYSQVVHDEYILKVYNKGNQYQMPINTCRIEKKVLKMRFQKNKVGIATLADVTPERLKKANQFLVEHLNEIIYFDNSIIKKELSKVDRKRIERFSNPNYWKNLSRNKRHENRKLLSDLIHKNSRNFKGELLEQIKKTGVRFHQQSENKKGVRFHYSNIGGIRTPDTPRKCPITGLSLEHEKKGAKYALTTTLKNVKAEDEKKYFELTSLLLSGTRFKQPRFESDIISWMAKQIRNRFYNPRPLKKIGYKKKQMPQLRLFE